MGNDNRSCSKRAGNWKLTGETPGMRLAHVPQQPAEESPQTPSSSSTLLLVRCSCWDAGSHSFIGEMAGGVARLSFLLYNSLSLLPLLAWVGLG